MHVSALPPVDSLASPEGPVDSPPPVVDGLVEDASAVEPSLPGFDPLLPAAEVLEPPWVDADVSLESPVEPPSVPDVAPAEADEPADAEPVLAGMKGSLPPTEHPAARSATTHETTKRNLIVEP